MVVKYPAKGKVMVKQQHQQSYPNYIRYYCKQRGYSIQGLAEKIGLPRRTMTDYVTGVRPVPRHWLVKIARALSCPMKDLLPAIGESAIEGIATEIKAATTHVQQIKRIDTHSLPIISTSDNAQLIAVAGSDAMQWVLPDHVQLDLFSPRPEKLLHKEQSGIWLVAQAYQFEQLFKAAWTSDNILGALKIILPIVKVIRTITYQEKEHNTPLQKSDFLALIQNSLSVAQKNQLIWALGTGIADAWNEFHHINSHQSLIIAQALLTLLQSCHNVIDPDTRSLFYSGVYRLIGAALFFQERYQEAHHTQDSAYITALECANIWNMAQSNVWKIYVYEAQGYYEEATQLISKTFRMIGEQQEEPYLRLQGHLLALWGENAVLKRQYNVAQEKLKAAAYISKNIAFNEEFDQRRWTHISGRCALFTQDYQNAIYSFEEVLSQLSSNSTMFRAITLIPLVTAYARSGKRETSIDTLQKILVSLDIFQAPIIQKQLYTCIQQELQPLFAGDSQAQTLIAEVQRRMHQSITTGLILNT